MSDCPRLCWLNGKPKGEHYPSCPLYEVPPWERCQECDKPLTKETTVRVVIGREAFADPKATTRQVTVYFHGPCAHAVFPPR